ILLRVFFAVLFIRVLFLPLTAVKPETAFDWIIFVLFYIVLLIMTVGAVVVCFFLGKFQLTIKPKWKFTLFQNEIVAHTNKEHYKRLTETVIPIHEVTRCVIVRREQRQRIRLNKRMFYRYYFH